MIFTWPEVDESKKILIDQVRSFAQSKIAPKARELDQTGQFPADIIRQLSEMGLMGMMVPEKFGGSEMDCCSYVMALEEVSAACASTGVILSVNNSLVCFLEEVSEFVNLKGEKMGPFEVGQIANIPKTVVNILIEDKKVELIDI